MVVSHAHAELFQKQRSWEELVISRGKESSMAFNARTTLSPELEVRELGKGCWTGILNYSKICSWGSIQHEFRPLSCSEDSARTDRLLEWN